VGWKKRKGIDKNLKICYNINVKKGDKRPAVARRRRKTNPCLSARNSFKWVGAGKVH
jgi:hypothetical protein